MLGGQSRRWKMRVVKNAKRQAWYLSKYLSKGDFERYYFSGGWVFPGWIGFSQWFKKEFGVYPPREMLVELGRMSKAERQEHTWFWLYLWEKEKQKLCS
jgi:hypothetical protein